MAMFPKVIESRELRVGLARTLKLTEFGRLSAIK